MLLTPYLKKNNGNPTVVRVFFRLWKSTLASCCEKFGKRFYSPLHRLVKPGEKEKKHNSNVRHTPCPRLCCKKNFCGYFSKLREAAQL